MKSATLFKALIAIESIVIFLLTTTFYLFALGLAILGFFAGNQNSITPAYLVLVGILAIPGYGLPHFGGWFQSMRQSRFNEFPDQYGSALL